MPAERLTHPREGHSKKLRQLSDFEYRVWCTYRWAANDVGVMRDAPTSLMDANAVLEERGAAVRKALDRIVDVGLLLRFDHKGDSYVCSPDWQDHQRIRYPSRTHLPTPTGDVCGACSEDTRKLFDKLSEKSRKTRGNSSDNSGNISENIPDVRGNVPESSGKDLESDRESSLRAPARKAQAIAQANAEAEGEPEREAPPPSPGPSPTRVPIGQLQLVVNELVMDWNARADRAGLQAVTNPSPSRQTLLNAVRLRPSMDEWREVLDRAFESDFMMGRKPGHDGEFFTLTLWWLLKDDHADKVLSGTYRNRTQAARVSSEDAKAAKEREAHEASLRQSNERLVSWRQAGVSK